MDFKEWSLKWINIYQINHLSKKTYCIYLDAINNHLIPEIGEIPLEKLNCETIEKYIAIKKKYLSNSTINLHLSIIKSIMNDAVDNNITNSFKLHKLKKLKLDQNKIKSFSLKEQYLIEDSYLLCRKQ